jgi:glycosyltransferase involved in cell wall biosynthesis
MNPQISVIVPIYKAEKYLNRCLDSILNQTFEEFELILIDDGSPDKCPQMCDEYLRKDRRIKVRHKKNEGVSKARNAGILISSSDYITFVDSDDYVSRDYLKNLMSQQDIDFVASGYYCEQIDGSIEMCKEKALDISLEEIRKSPEIMLDVPKGLMCSKRYKRKILLDHNILFDDEMKRGEDSFFNLTYISNCKSIRVLSCVDYYYCYTNDSASRNFEKKLFEWSKQSVDQIGKIIGCDNDIFFRVVWKNTDYVIDDYFKNARGASLNLQFKIMICLFEVCCNRQVRKSVKFSNSKKMKNMILLYLLPLVPIMYEVKQYLININETSNDKSKNGE